jgi:hypothetical protein
MHPDYVKFRLPPECVRIVARIQELVPDLGRHEIVRIAVARGLSDMARDLVRGISEQQQPAEVETSAPEVEAPAPTTTEEGI